MDPKSAPADRGSDAVELSSPNKEACSLQVCTLQSVASKSKTFPTTAPHLRALLLPRAGAWAARARGRLLPLQPRAAAAAAACAPACTSRNRAESLSVVAAFQPIICRTACTAAHTAAREHPC
jgi:hypothetical protein